MRRNLLALGWLATVLGLPDAQADLVYFRRGGEAQLPATIEGPTVQLDPPGGPKTFPLADLRAIVPARPADAEWADRRDRARRDGGAPASFEAIWWALENGLTTEATSLLRDSRSTSAGHGPTRLALAALDSLALPCPDPDLGPLRRSLPGSDFAAVRGDHVILLHQGNEAEARERLDVIERVVQTFYLALASQGIELPPPGRRLVSVYFARRRDYVAFLRESDAGAFAETQGYYHPTLRVVFAFDTRGDAAQSSGRRAIANLRREGGPSPELDRRTLLLDLDWRATDLGIAAHETVHQLTEASGLAPRFDDFPLWLHEGFAAQFEVVRGGRWAGFGRVHDLRLPDWRSIHPAPRLDPLLRDADFGRGYRRDAYAGSWALVYFLRKTRPREFLAFVDLLRSPSPSSATVDGRSIQAFRAAFGGDLPVLEAEWHRYLGELRTTLEIHRPGATGSSETHLVRPDDGP